MEFSQVQKVVGSLPHIARPNAKMLYDFIIKHDIRQVLEIGFAHGVASCFIAAALQEVWASQSQAEMQTRKRPKLTSVDFVKAGRHYSPSIEELLGQLDLQEYVDVHWTQTGYHWFLRDEIRDQSVGSNVCRPKYDLAIIDCSKNWTLESGGFFLVDKLLKFGGTIIWDDYHWTYAKADRRRSETEGILHSSLTTDEREISHIREVVHLLAMQHPYYRDFKIIEDENWVWARKDPAEEGEGTAVKRIRLARVRLFSWYWGSLLHLVASVCRRVKEAVGRPQT